jgi:hypothetical protein
MSLTIVQIRFLQSLVTDRSRRKESNAAEYFQRHYGIGARVGRGYEYSEQDCKRAEDILRSHELPLDSLPSGSFDRADSINRPGVSEKSGTTSPHANAVAFKLFGNTEDRTGKQIPATPVGYQVASPKEVAEILADVAIVVENFETFRKIEQYKWVVDSFSTKNAVLVLFRGDNIYKLEDALATLSRMKCPTWGFCDFDPAGLFICSSLPRLSKVLLPPLDALKVAALRGRRYDLFDTQVDQYRTSLNSSTHAEIRGAWELLQALRIGLPQEWTRDL